MGWKLRVPPRRLEVQLIPTFHPLRSLVGGKASSRNLLDAGSGFFPCVTQATCVCIKRLYFVLYIVCLFSEKRMADKGRH